MGAPPNESRPRSSRPKRGAFTRGPAPPRPGWRRLPAPASTATQRFADGAPPGVFHGGERRQRRVRDHGLGDRALGGLAAAGVPLVARGPRNAPLGLGAHPPPPCPPPVAPPPTEPPR